MGLGGIKTERLRDGETRGRGDGGSGDEVMKIDSIIAGSMQGLGLKFTFQYDLNDKMTELLNWYWTGTDWEKSFKENYLYDSNSVLTTEFNLGWNQSEWDSLSRIDYSYVEGELARLVFLNYDGINWINWFRESYRYYDNGDIKSELLEDFINDNWQYTGMWTYYYSCSTMTILFQTWRNNAWQDSINTDFFYNEQGDLDSAVARLWDGNYWVNYLKLEVTNDHNHNQIQRIEKYWENNDWQNSYKYDYAFNELHYIENAHCNVWTGSQWVEGNGDILIENPDGFRIGFLAAQYADVYYEGTVGTDDSPAIQIPDYALFPNYPNPFNPTTTIKFRIPVSGFVELKVYDALGREDAVLVDEYKTSGTYEVRFNAGSLASGVYIYTLRTGGYTATGKMIVEK
jgi:hypothetical protein